MKKKAAKTNQGWKGEATAKRKKKSAPTKKASASDSAIGEVKPRGKVTHRVNTIKGNGSLPTSREVLPPVADDDLHVPIAEAMRRAVEALGEVVVDDTLAADQLRQLADYYEEVTRAQAAFAQRSEAAKIAKKSLESATEMLLERVRAFTHPVALPLFDQVQAEDDQAAMEAAADAELPVGDSEDEPTADDPHEATL